MHALPATLRIGIHMRMGDSALANTIKKGEKRYKAGCAIQPISHSTACMHLIAAEVSAVVWWVCLEVYLVEMAHMHKS